MEARNRAFQLLKPPCVKLSESALKLMGKGGNIKDVVRNLEQVRETLQKISVQKDVLNDKLADYAFFPLSHVLKQLEKLPVRAQELTLECLSILLRTAWKHHMAPELGIQLLILFSFMADQKGAKTSEELQELILQCFRAVFQTLGYEQAGQEALTNTATVPHLGKAASVILDGVSDGSSDVVQLAAIEALEAFTKALSDLDALATSFLPGIMSCLTKVLTPKAAKRSSKVLAASLDVLGYLLPRIFNDTAVRKLPETPKKRGSTTQLDQTWLKATSPQIKMALANIIKLRQHDRSNVKRALAALSVAILEQCRESLSESTSMMLENIVTLADKDDRIEKELQHLLLTDQQYAEALRSSLHYWIISLPRIMQLSDDTAKTHRMHQISLSFRLLSEQGVDMSIIETNLASNLRDSVLNAIHDPKEKRTIIEYSSEVTSLELAHLNQSHSIEFDQILASKKSQIVMVDEVSNLVRQLSQITNSFLLVQDLINGLHGSSGNVQLASLWLSLNLLRQSIEHTMAMDDILDFGSSQANQKEDLLEQVYDFSVGILTESSAVERDWRLQAIALEAIAFQASQQKLDFRNELIEALYPVLHLLGSPVPQLRDHAITCLNIVAKECGYMSSGELVVANVDYLVNAVALRLNSFDISPQAPQVLLMMVKLSGPSLLPYLDDLVDSMFAALESFHGYPKLAELLFSVLKVIVEEGVKAPLLAIEAEGEHDKHRKRPLESSYMPAVATSIADVRNYKAKVKETDVDIDTNIEAFPQRPWKEPQSMEEEAKDEPPPPSDVELPPPAPKTYSLLLNISKLTQHYLTSSSPELRTSLLALLNTTFPALAKHENSFLPLINTLWRVLLSRLEDSEAYVVVGVLNVIRAMCINAGDFMSGRISEAWPSIKRIYRTRTGKAGSRFASSRSIRPSTTKTVDFIITQQNQQLSQSSAQAHYVDAPSRIIWDSLVQLLTTIVSYVATDDEAFEDTIQMLAPVITSRTDIREALEGRNADAVWLALFRMDTSKPHHNTNAITDNASQQFSSVIPASTLGRQFALLA
ncbi:ARM repeat-containing protein [Tothia fuscella]|uniref:ARM repeat-containing protein n=1 Tax=Tothia fuscella TaxID=1048955 RepID=A0A9P4NY64_9PEZI|nr:ARM repeat-containing protein [Tothia fuscella]